MRSCLLVAIAVTALAVPAFAETPTIASLTGSWWDEQGAMMINICDSGAGSMLKCASQTALAGFFTLSKDGELAFAIHEKPECTWTASMDGDFLVLKEKDGRTRRCRLETQAAREERCGKVLAELEKATLALETPNAESGAADKARERAKELEAQAFPLILSLAGDGEESTARVDALLKKYAPVILKRREAHRESRWKTDCRTNLRQIGIYISLYENKHKAWPKDLAALREKNIAEDETVFRCPITKKPDAYDYVFPAKQDETPLDAVLAHDREAHPDGKRCVLTFRGAVFEMTEEEFQRALKEGADAVTPRIRISSSKVVPKGAGKELVVEGTVQGLRAETSADKRVVRATVTIESGRTKAPLRSEPVSIEGPADSQPLKFTVRIDLAGAATENSTWSVVARDLVRNEDAFETVTIKR